MKRRKGYDIPKNQWGYQLAALLMNTKELKLWLHLKLTPGNETPQRLFDTLVNELQLQRKLTNFDVKVILMDAGFASREHFISLDQLNYKFISASPRHSYLEGLVFKDVYEEKYGGGTQRYAEAILYIDGVKLKVVRGSTSKTTRNRREGSTDGEKVHFFVTNLTDLSARDIMELHSEWWSIENSLFRELKSGFRLYVPSRDFVANVVYLSLVQLGFNVFQLAIQFAKNYTKREIRG